MTHHSASCCIMGEVAVLSDFGRRKLELKGAGAMVKRHGMCDVMYCNVM